MAIFRTKNVHSTMPSVKVDFFPHFLAHCEYLHNNDIHNMYIAPRAPATSFSMCFDGYFNVYR